MGPLGVQEMLGIFLIALLLFGPKKLPELGRMVGKGMREFKRMKNEVRTTFETHMQELEREARLADLHTKTLSSAPDYSSVNYPYPYEESVPEARTYEATPAATSAIESGTEAPSDPVEGTVARGGFVPPAITTPNGAKPIEEEHPA
jgi:sec-independent protein translocase protein TatA